MGKQNRIKHLLGRFNKETNCEIKALQYSFGGVVRDIFLKVDLNHDNSLAVANVPYFLDETTFKELCSRTLGTPAVHVQLTASTALYGDLKKGYRSGHVVFATIQARRRAFDAIRKGSSSPFELEKLNINLPAWHEPPKANFRKRKHVPDEEEGEESMEFSDKEQKVEAVHNNEPDQEGWVTVTRKHKLSFRGKVNKPNEASQNRVSDQNNMECINANIPPKKKRRR